MNPRIEKLTRKIKERNNLREQEIKEKSGPYESFIYPLDFQVKEVLARHYANTGIIGEMQIGGLISSTETGISAFMKIKVSPKNNDSGIERILFKGNANIKSDEIIRAYFFHGIEFANMHNAMINLRDSEFYNSRELEQKVYMPREVYNKEERALFIENLRDGKVDRIDISAHANEELYEIIQKRLIQQSMDL
jgi:hypothetical protein